jgi:DNA-binding transcriptional ArsR family regulator
MNETAFVRVFGKSPIIKLLDFLILERGLFDYSISELSENTGISWVTADKLIKSFVKTGIVKKTRKVGTADMYALNEENPITQALIGVYNMLSKIMIEGEGIRVETIISEKAMAVVLNGKEDVRETIRELYK